MVVTVVPKPGCAHGCATTGATTGATGTGAGAPGLSFRTFLPTENTGVLRGARLDRFFETCDFETPMPPMDRSRPRAIIASRLSAAFAGSTTLTTTDPAMTVGRPTSRRLMLRILARELRI